MKKILLLVCQVSTIIFCIAQHDSTLINKYSNLKKGIYRSYEEYLHNAPSITSDFESTWLITKSGKDTVVTGARCHLIDNTKVHDAWGFCDGRAVFINTRISTFKKRFLLAECLGKNPYLRFWHKDIYAIGPPLFALATVVASAIAPPSFDLLFINPLGKAKQASYRQMKKLFQPVPQFLQSFMTEKQMNTDLKIQYLAAFND